MRKLFLAICLLPILLLLVGCPNQTEVKEMMNDLKDSKSVASKAIDSSDYSLESLLRIHDFFFGFGEKVHLVKAEEQGLKSLKSLIKSGGIKKFCQGFVIPVRQWENLEAYCTGSDFYRCSPDIKEYKNTLGKLLGVLGSDITQAFSREPECN